MKTQISRWSDDPAKRRSGIYQQQGRMITDADLNELVELLKRRVDAALGEVVGTGAPRAGGVGFVSAGPMLHPGTLYADGVRARLESSTAGAASFPLNAQADFPAAALAPTGSAHVLYADIWELATSALQDASQLDPGLHGADTSTRTQMLAQVKWCAAADVPDPLGAPQNPRKGDATAALEFRAGQAEADPCDPCAAEIALDARVGNYLFRVEVHDVKGPANAPTEVTLKWSSENGAEQHAQADVPAEFKRGDWIYEFYSDTTERHLGVHLGFAPQRARLTDGWPDAADLPAAATYPYVRRWDGYAILTKGASWAVKIDSGALQAKDKGRVFTLLTTGTTPTHGHYTIGAQLVAHLSGLKLTLALDAKKFVAGDFWLATVRENAEEAQRVQQATTLPIGIDHHYLKLATVTGAAAPTFDDAATRRLSFPPLADLTADRVGYDPVPKAARWTDIIDAGTPPPPNVQSAIDTLVEKLESSDIGYNLPTCPVTHLNTLRQLLFGTAPANQKVNDLLDRLLCFIDAASIPYAVTSAPGITVKSVLDTHAAELLKRVLKAGDTMTGALVVNPAPPVPLSVDVKGTLQTEQFKLIAPAGTPNRAVLTYESATGLAKWLETSLTAWNLAGGNLSTEPSAVTGAVTIGRSTTINGNLQLNGSLFVTGSSPYALAAHNHDSRYLSSVDFQSHEYLPGQERQLAVRANRPALVTFAYNTYDASGVPQWGTTFVNGPFSNLIEVKVIKVSPGSGGSGDKDYRITVRNNNTVRLWIGVEVFE
jgi:hypothetical protein